MVFVLYAGDPAPAINEAHYLAKAKNFWQPQHLLRKPAANGVNLI